jgi:UPF0755 protein
MARRSVKAATREQGGDSARQRASRPYRYLLWALLALLLGTGISLFAVGRLSRGSGGARNVQVTLVGDARDLETLASEGIVASESVARIYFKLLGVHARPGEHLLPAGETLGRVASLLGGAGPSVRVVFPEGITRFEMGKRLEAAGVCSKQAFVRSTQSRDLLAELRLNGDSLEGFLFPATYEFPKDADAVEIARRLKSEFDKRYGQLESVHASSRLDLAQSLKWSTREIVTLASMIEKEAVVDEERALVSSVFVNRLRTQAFVPKRLQCDPTGMYGCVLQQEGLQPVTPGCARYAGKATHDVNVDAQNSYSTYTHEGLPPGPIANPGAKSLAAALSPAITPYLYFVAKGQGRHTFSETYSAHERAVKPAPQEEP